MREDSFLSTLGIIVDGCIRKISEIYTNINVDKYAIMPNHIHMIITIARNDVSGGRPMDAPTVSRIINHFKGAASKGAGFSIWQKGFYDHIIRDEQEYFEVWDYIDTNPMKWNEDKYFVEVKKGIEI